MSRVQPSRWVRRGAIVLAALIGAALVPLTAGPAAGIVNPDGEFHPVTPVRLLDTRITGGALGPNSTRAIDVAGQVGLPATAEMSAVVVNVTAVTPSTTSYITIWPNGAQKPLASNLNTTAGVNRPNLVTVKIGTEGKIQAYNNAGTVHLVFDVAGYYSTAAGTEGFRFHPVDPVRKLNTAQTGGKIGGGANNRVVDLDSGSPAVPDAATAVVINVAVFQSTTNSFLTIYPGDVGSPPTTANLNFTTNLTVANLVTVRLPADGTIKIYNGAGLTHVVVDIMGYYDDVKTTEAGRYVPMFPERYFDTGSPGLPPFWEVDGFFADDQPITADAIAVLFNLSASKPQAKGFASAFPSDVAEYPSSSNLNFYAGQTIPNLVIVKLSVVDPCAPDVCFPPGSAGALNGSQGYTRLVFDVGGYFTGDSGIGGTATGESSGEAGHDFRLVPGRR